MKKVKLLTLAACLLPSLSFAHNLTLNKEVPSVSIEQYGEIFFKNSAATYQNWNTEQLKGKVRVLQAIAGRSSAKAMNADLMSAITLEKFPETEYQTTTIINQDDSIWGTGGFVKSSAEESKEEFSWSSMVLDEHGKVAKAWDLQPESSAIIVQDKEGKILFIKEGKLSNDEIMQVIALIHTQL
ncbi:YtfJ family protein [Aliivibrio fischeri]|uniref:YtfJ family protein n=1 Tax=Aliivibrio fischeri TaxID=668 RepID=UPI0012DAACB3|nr:YtfJ family protein [Aliivibrio fischeri]MUJ35995.1 YtfJ family protein [Aliivibrio fischeri]